MAFIVNMPRLGLNEEENVLAEWYVQEGDVVEAGDKLFSIETDKSTMEVFAEQAGTVLKLLYGSFDVVPVMTGVCVIGEPGEDVSAIVAAAQETALQAQDGGGAGAEAQADKAPPSTPRFEELVQRESMLVGGTARISPRARKLADANGIALQGIRPSGAEGRIVEEDILQAMRSAPQSSGTFVAPSTTSPSAALSPGGTTTPTSNIRRIIGSNMMNSLLTTAQTTQHMRFNASKLQSYRTWLKAAPGPEKHITLLGLISYITVKTLTGFDYINAHMSSPEGITRFGAVHLGCAVNTTKGLMVPTVRNAQSMNLAAFAAALDTLIRKAREGRLLPDEMTDATFTVSNLGNFGVTYFTPILNPPQVGILGIGAIETAVKSTPEGMLCYPAGYLSLTYDHRALDGAPAAEFFRALCENLETAEMLSVGETI